MGWRCTLYAIEMVTAVIPTYERAATIGRAIQSVLDQSHDDLEVVVVDDASVDKTADVVDAFESDKVRYVRLEQNVGGGGARNVGIEHARGEYVAFLDSDDVWMPSHLEDSLRVLRGEALDGVLSSFCVDRGSGPVPFLCQRFSPGTSMVDYILGSGGGDPRSSTMMFKREAVSAIRFDPLLRKHQDWDLAIRFSDAFRLGVKHSPSVIMNVEREDRMSARANPEATQVFLDRHISSAKAPTAARTYTVLMRRALFDGGERLAYERYRKYAWTYVGAASPRILAEMALVSVPPLARAVLKARALLRETRSGRRQ